ncbi:MAG: MmcQ/YjbR family DNA-binding protein [Saprospiraceae bacterium]|nr:MmcQ/YjbR family DNA-binding protein [Saprospiraceae bacterium]
MDLDGLIRYNAAKAGVEETFPFDENTLVWKVMGKMFAASNITEDPLRVNLKCDPDWALELRDEYPEIIPGYHMNKKHWNTVIVGEGNLDQSIILKLIDHSYGLVVKSLTKAKKMELEQLKKEDGDK